MKHSFLHIVLPVILLLTANHTYSQSDSISKLVLNNKQSILNDRAFFMFPVEAQNMARGTNLMSADPNKDTETRIVLDIGQARMVFFAQELYTYTNENLLTIVAKEDRDDFKSRLLLDKDSIVSVLSMPLTFDTTQNAILVNSLFVRTADKTVFRISAYITPESYKYKDQFLKLSENVFASLTKGTRQLNSKARTETWPIYEGKQKFSIEIPGGYIITKDAKYDFEVLKFQKITDMNDHGQQNLIIYTGRHPSFFYPEQGFAESDATKIKGSFVGKKTDWLYFKSPERNLYIKEQQVPGDKIEKGLLIHVAMISDKPEAIEELTKIVENIKLIQ